MKEELGRKKLTEFVELKPRKIAIKQTTTMKIEK